MHLLTIKASDNCTLQPFYLTLHSTMLSISITSYNPSKLFNISIKPQTSQKLLKKEENEDEK